MRGLPPFLLFLLIASLALVSGVVVPAHAAGDKWALLIGVDKCEAIGELKVCSADALALKSVLEQIGYPDNHITVLTDSNQSNINATPTIGNVERAIKRLAQVAEADDKILFFFSGHGVTHNGTSFLVPTDGDLTKGVSLTWIKDQFATCKAKEKVMILDACHSGAAKGVSGITPDLKTAGNLVMLLSCEKEQVSWPDKQGRHSVFTSAILEGLSGKAANADRKVTHKTLAAYVRKSVKDWTYENQKNEQTPVMVADASGDIILADIALMKPASVKIPAAANIAPKAAGNRQRESFGDFSYTINGDNLTITKYTGSGGEVVIPSTINEKTVTGIGDRAFMLCADVTSVTIPNSIASIGAAAFYQCFGLTNITIPNSVTSIDNRAFRYCNSLTSISIPHSVTNLGDGAFGNCAALTSATLGNGVTSIGSDAFSYCSSLENVTIGNGVTSIGNSAFMYCPSLKGVYFKGNAPRDIGVNVFKNSSNATVYYLPETTGWDTQFESRPTAKFRASEQRSVQTEAGSGAGPTKRSVQTKAGPKSAQTKRSVQTEAGAEAVQSSGDFVYTSNGDNLTITKYTGSGGEVVIPPTINGQSVTSIGERAFRGCTKLTGVTIPAGVTNIGYDAFQACGQLTDITIPDGVTSIGPRAFGKCVRLTSVTIPNSVKEIEELAFAFTDLASVTIPESVTVIGARAFLECANLTKVEFLGNTPVFEGDIFLRATRVTVYYQSGTTGWGATFGGRPTKVVTP